MIDDGAEIKDPKMIANRFNDFFTNIGPSLASKIPPPDTTVLEHILSSDLPVYQWGGS